MLNTTKKTKINPDLAREREKCTFKILEFTHLLDGGPEATQKRRQQEIYFLDDPELMNGPPFEYLSHAEKYEEVLRRIYVLKKRGKLNDVSKLIPSTSSAAIFHDASPIDVHYGMFIPAIREHGTEEQQKIWLPRALNCEILGTYAQTELGHGTFIRGLETTATYDPLSQEFILNSPKLSSYKWWPGSLGTTSNHAVVIAQLYSLGKCYGPHMFIVELRDKDTHRPLPGVKVGDIGAKFGMSGANNGFLGLQGVRIPRENMLMRNSKISESGEYTHSVSNKLTYGIMLGVRVAIVLYARDCIKIAATIAVRYSAVRRQSQQKPDEPECQILDYMTQQHKLLPQIATSLAFHYTGLWIKNMHVQVTSELQSGNLNQLPELHALSSCLKAVTSADATKAVETCRMACGGHGYMMCSNFPLLYGLIAASCTYEGENTVMLLQTARSLMKAWSKVVEGKPLAPIVEYLRTAKNSKEVAFEKSIDWIVWALERISARKIELTWKHMNSQIQRGTPTEDAWNLTSIELVAAAEIYARTFIVKTYRNMTLSTVESVSRPLKVVLLQLLDLYGVHTVLTLRGELLEFTDVKGGTIDTLQDWLVELLVNIRPNAVGIVDGFDMRDEMLKSALGAYDGNVYERLFEAASKSPLNSEQVNKSFELYLKPFLKSKF